MIGIKGTLFSVTEHMIQVYRLLLPFPVWWWYFETKVRMCPVVSSCIIETFSLFCGGPQNLPWLLHLLWQGGYMLIKLATIARTLLSLWHASRAASRGVALYGARVGPDELLESGGSDAMCPICLLPPTDPVRLDCTVRYCRCTSFVFLRRSYYW